MGDNDFHTFSEYMKKKDNMLSASTEDYLEMIFRLSENTGFTRIHELSEALNVHPPSATRMVQRLGKMNILKYEKYGVIILLDEGKKLGALLLKRHRTVESFLRLLNVPEEKLLKETEKVEHTLGGETIICLEEYISFIKDNPDIELRFNEYFKRDKEV
jgi:Mn-dependent DtxR family transcriptional regulator